VGIDILDKYVEQVKVVLNRIDVSYDTTKSPCLTILVGEGKKNNENKNREVKSNITHCTDCMAREPLQVPIPFFRLLRSTNISLLGL
jgi:hypothetical protein